MNTIEDPKVAAERLMQRAWNRDGLPELAAGLVTLTWAILFCGAAVLPKRSPLFVADVLAASFGCPLLGLVTPRLVKWVRGRYLTDRVGYVRHGRNKQRERKVLWYGILSAIVVACALLLGHLLFRGWNQWVLLMAGLLGGMWQIAFGWWTGVPRMVVTGLLWALSGAALSLTNLPIEIAMPAWLGIGGLVGLVTGGTVLLRFLAESGEGDSGGN
jgi:hypothetical protein